ncbi:MAG: hypothetical protein ACLQJR_18995 [Stellaceae bacterium]
MVTWKPAGLALAAALATLAVGEAARAEYPPLLVFGRILSAAPEDLPIVREASAPLFDAAAAGTTREWSNPRTGDSGAIKLRRIFALKGMPCRTFDYTTWTEHHTNETRVVGDWCKLTDDGWKLVDPREPVPGSSEE